MKIRLYVSALLCVLGITVAHKAASNDATISYEHLSDAQKEIIEKKLREFRSLDAHQKQNELRRTSKDPDGKRHDVNERVNLIRKQRQ